MIKREQITTDPAAMKEAFRVPQVSEMKHAFHAFDFDKAGGLEAQRIWVRFIWAQGILLKPWIYYCD